MDQKLLNARQVSPSQISALSTHLPPNPSPLLLKYLYALENHAPGLLKLIRSGRLLQFDKSESRMGAHGVEKVEGCVRTASDFSYSAPSYAGEGYRIVGDAGGMPTVLILVHRECLLMCGLEFQHSSILGFLLEYTWP